MAKTLAVSKADETASSQSQDSWSKQGAPFKLDRATHFVQQPARSSKRLKRQLVTSMLDFGLPMRSAVMASPSERKLLGEQFLACLEDPSFIYKQNFEAKESGETGEALIATRPSLSSSSAFSDSLMDGISAASQSSSNLDLSSSSSQASDSSRSSPDWSPSESLLEEQARLARSSSPSCISAFDYCHLTSASSLYAGSLACFCRDQSGAGQLEGPDQRRDSDQEREPEEQRQSPQRDSACLEDEQLFNNLILKERAELWRRDQARSLSDSEAELALTSEQRHSLLSWMLHICEHQACQDEIFPLASMILDKFLHLNRSNEKTLEEVESEQEEEDQMGAQMYPLDSEELRRRQLVLFAGCALILATKFRQTPKLYIQTLVEYSRSELPIELSRDEILDGELLLLSTLKWDLAALVTPNEFLPILWRKCSPSIAASYQIRSSDTHTERCDTDSGLAPEDDEEKEEKKFISIGSQETSEWQESSIKRHTQTLIELCLMGKFHLS